jgi:hypothetical protein
MPAAVSDCTMSACGVSGAVSDGAMPAPGMSESAVPRCAVPAAGSDVSVPDKSQRRAYHEHERPADGA